MKLIRPLVSLALLFTAACAGDPPAKDPEPEKPLPPELASLRDALSEKDAEYVLFRLYKPSFKGTVWTYPEGSKVDRPNKDIPHVTLKPEDLETLRGMATEKELDPGKGDYLSYSYILEVVRDGKPIHRMDFHTRGMGKPMVFLISKGDKRLSDGAEALAFRGTWRKWRKALEAIWAERNQ